MLKQRIINICGYSFEILYFLFKKKKKKKKTSKHV